MTIFRMTTFDNLEMGLLDASVALPVKIPTKKYITWMYKPFPILAALKEPVIWVLQQKIAAGMIEPCCGAYANCWFVIQKTDGIHLHFIQDLKKLVGGCVVEQSAVQKVGHQQALLLPQGWDLLLGRHQPDHWTFPDVQVMPNGP
ncbi:hypothetical protein LPJ79_003871 [Coemansia sp. RSA 1821]|nr:hypothetical protein LPJ79_003871 [Coemansia sp. RSA 1821]